MGDGFLHRYFLNNGDKIVHKWLHYFDIYEHHLERFRGKNPVMLEIGVAGGGSLQMWKAYLGPGAKIIGLDIDPDCKHHEAEGIEVFIGNQTDSRLLNSILKAYPKVDIVLDDGSHVMRDMIATFEHLYPRLDANGVYIVEDLHTSYWDDFGGGFRAPGTFVEFVKERVDDINAAHTRDAIPISDFTRSTYSVSVYDSIAAFEKRPQGRRQSLRTGHL